MRPFLNNNKTLNFLRLTKQIRSNTHFIKKDQTCLEAEAESCGSFVEKTAGLCENDAKKNRTAFWDVSFFDFIVFKNQQLS